MEDDSALCFEGERENVECLYGPFLERDAKLVGRP